MISAFFSGALMKRLLCALAATTAGCASLDVQPTTTPDVPVPEHFDVYAHGIQPPTHWWTAFDDPQLNVLVDEALADNQSLRQAWARMAQAAAQAGITSAALLPEVNLRTRSFGRTRTDVRSADGVAPEGVYYTDSLIAGAGLSWELDSWKRVANTAEAAVLAAEASHAQMEATALAISGQVVDAWFTIRAQTELLAVLQEQVRVSEALLASVEHRYANGLGTSLQVLQQRQQLEAVQAVVPGTEARLDTAWNVLATLLGRPPQHFGTTRVRATLPTVPAFPALGAPGDLLVQRPDLRSAQRLLASADHAVAAAVAAQLPTLRLTIDGDLQGTTIGGGIDSTTGSIGGSLFQPIFDANRRRLEVDRQRAIVEERLGAFSETFLTALREVDDALEQERWQAQLLDEIAVQMHIARAQLTEAHRQYTEGVAEYLDVISAIQTLQSLQRQDVEARRQRLVYRANLYLALGGTWMNDLTPPTGTAAILEDEENAS